MIDIAPCIKDLGSMYWCEYTDRCEAGSKIPYCANDLAAEKIPEKELEILKEDAKEEGYWITRIENHIKMLNQESPDVDLYTTSRGHLTVPFWSLIKKYGELVRLERLSPANRTYNLRASEKDCDIARIIAKVNQEKLLGSKIIESKTGVAGTSAHTLFNRNEESTIYYTTQDEIIIKGHSDGDLMFESGAAVGVIDQKRAKFSLVETENYKRQTLTYAMGLCQMLKLKPKYVFGILIKRPFIKSRGDYRRPRYSIVVAEYSPSNPLLKEIDAEWRRTYRAQKYLINNLEAVEERKLEELTSKKGCVKTNQNGEKWPCFATQSCDYLRQLSKESGRPLIQILRELEVVDKEWVL